MFYVSSDDLYGAKHLPSISLSSKSNINHGRVSGLNMAPFCLDKVALAVQNSLYCHTRHENFPWIKLEYQEEVKLNICSFLAWLKVKCKQKGFVLFLPLKLGWSPTYIFRQIFV